jgi:hypothetical protein
MKRALDIRDLHAVMNGTHEMRAGIGVWPTLHWTRRTRRFATLPRHHGERFSAAACFRRIANQEETHHDVSLSRRA